MEKPKTMHSTLIAAFAGALWLGVSPAMAHEGVDHSKGEVHGDAKGEDQVKRPPPHTPKDAAPDPDITVMSSRDGMNALYARLQEVEARIAGNQRIHIHDAVAGVAAATRNLDRDSTLDAAKKKRVQGYVKNVAKLMDKLHDALDGDKTEDAKKAFTQLKAQVDLLDKQFAHSQNTAPSAKPQK